MNILSASNASAAPVVATKDLGRPSCPRCGSILLLAERSQFNLRGRIDHAWACDDCGRSFVTSISLHGLAPEPE